MTSPPSRAVRVQVVQPNRARRPFAHREALDCRPPAVWPDGAPILLLMLGGLTAVATLAVWLIATS